MAPPSHRVNGHRGSAVACGTKEEGEKRTMARDLGADQQMLSFVLAEVTEDSQM